MSIEPKRPTLIILALWALASATTVTYAAGRCPSSGKFSKMGNDGKPFHITFRDGSVSARSDNGSASDGICDQNTGCIRWTNPRWRTTCSYR